MKNSLLQKDKTTCFLCGKNGCYDHLEKHHIFGAYNRQKSEEDGIFVFLCGDSCHRNGKHAAHRDKQVMDGLHRIGQEAWEQHYGSREEFIKRYGKNYLD